MPEKKPHLQPIVITFTIDPALKLNTQSERVLAVSVVARQGDVGQVSQFDMRNWKTDLPAEVDRLMRLLLGGLALPDFPDLSQASATSKAEKMVDAPKEAEEIGGVEDVEEVEDVEPEPEALAEDEGDYDIAFYPAAGDAGEAGSSQPGLF